MERKHSSYQIKKCLALIQHQQLGEEFELHELVFAQVKGNALRTAQIKSYDQKKKKIRCFLLRQYPVSNDQINSKVCFALKTVSFRHKQNSDQIQNDSHTYV